MANPNNLDSKKIDASTESLKKLNSVLEKASRTYESHADSIRDYENRTDKAAIRLKNLSKEQAKADNTLKKSESAIRKTSKAIDHLKIAYKKGKIDLESYTKASKKQTTVLAKAKKEHKDLIHEQKKGTKVLSEHAVRFEGVNKVLSRLNDNTASAKKLAQEAFNPKGIQIHNKALEEMVSLRLKDLKLQRAEGFISARSYKNKIAQAKKYSGKLLDKSSEGASEWDRLSYRSKGQSFGSEGVSKLERSEAKSELQGKVLSGGRDLKSNVSKMFKGDGSGLEGINKQWQAYKKLSKTTGDMAGQSSLLTGTFGKLSSAMGAIGKLGWIGLLISAIGAMAKFVNKMDEFIKKANQSYFALQGPITSIDGLSKSMRGFTDTLYNADIKMKYGIDAKEATDVFKGFSGQGMSLEGIESSTGGFDEALEKSIVLSRVFGTTLGDMGGNISDQMLNLRSSIDEVSDGFSKMAFDASIAGIQSNKFYQSILSASSGLSFYGNYLQSTSGMLSKFIKDGSLGFKDATKLVTGLVQGIGGMSDDTARQFYGVLGPEAMQKISELNLKAIQQERASVLKQLDSESASGDEKKIAALNKRLRSLQADEDQAFAQVKSDDMSDKGQAFKKIMAHNPADAYIMMFDRMNTSITDAKSVATTKLRAIAKTFGMDEKTFDMMRKKGQITRTAIERGGSGATLDLAKRIGSGEANLKEGLTKEDKAILKNLKTSGLLDAFLQAIAEGNFTNSDELIDSVARETLTGDLGEKFMKEEEMAKIAEKVGALTNPLSKMIGIGKEQMTYAIASSDPMTALTAGMMQVATNTGGILNYARDRFRKDNKKALKAFKESGDASRVADASKEIAASQTEIERLDAKGGLSLQEANKRDFLVGSIPSLEKKIADIKSNKKYSGIGSAISDAEKKGLAASTEKGSLSWLSEEFKNSGYVAQKDKKATGAITRTTGLDGTTLKTMLETIMDPSADMITRDATLDAMFNGEDVADRNNLLDPKNSALLDTFMNAKFKAKGGEDGALMSEAVKDSRTEIVIRMDPHLTAELLKNQDQVVKRASMKYVK